MGGAGTGQAYVRWTEALEPGSGRLIGAGAEYQKRAVHGLEPKLSVDVWRSADRATGVRGELAATWSRRSTDRALFSLAVGAKTHGYLLGYPRAARGYITVGAGIRLR